MRKSGSPFKSSPSLAEFIVGGDVPLHSGRVVTIEGHRAQLGSKVIGNGPTVHRLIFASRGKDLVSYTKFKQILNTVRVIVVGMKFVMAPLLDWLLILFPAHKALHDQGILHGNLSYGNTSFFEAPQDHMYRFLADPRPRLSQRFSDKLPRDTADILNEQREKGP